jgi:hypothetical protein
LLLISLKRPADQHEDTSLSAYRDHAEYWAYLSALWEKFSNIFMKYNYINSVVADQLEDTSCSV